MKKIKYYIEYLYNIILDFIDLTPNDVVNINSNMNKSIDLIDLQIIDEIEKSKNIRWNNFYNKYKD